jgi:hypothetical protein
MNNTNFSQMEEEEEVEKDVENLTENEEVVISFEEDGR